MRTEHRASDPPRPNESLRGVDGNFALLIKVRSALIFVSSVLNNKSESKNCSNYNPGCILFCFLFHFMDLKTICYYASYYFN